MKQRLTPEEIDTAIIAWWQESIAGDHLRRSNTNDFAVLLSNLIGAQCSWEL